MSHEERPKQSKTTIVHNDMVGPTRRIAAETIDGLDGLKPRGQSGRAAAGGGIGAGIVAGGPQPGMGTPRAGAPTQIHSGEQLMPLPKAELNTQALLENLARIAGIQVDTPTLLNMLKATLGISVDPVPLIEKLASMAGINLVLQNEPVTQNPRPVTGWLVVIRGPGQGFSQPLTIGRNLIGRAPDQPVPLNYGDQGISREAHFSITFDPRSGRFLCTPGERQINLCYINDEPLVETIALKGVTDIELSDTVLRFVPLCGDAFRWTDA